RIEPKARNLRQHLPLERDRCDDPVERAQPIGRDDDPAPVRQIVIVVNLAAVTVRQFRDSRVLQQTIEICYKPSRWDHVPALCCRILRTLTAEAAHAGTAHTRAGTAHAAARTTHAGAAHAGAGTTHTRPGTTSGESGALEARATPTGDTWAGTTAGEASAAEARAGTPAREARPAEARPTPATTPPAGAAPAGLQPAAPARRHADREAA